jgi:exodeoxyribonuclease VII large subunit
MNDGLVFSVTDFVAVFNQTLDYAYPEVVIEGELSDFRISRGKWLYFDLKDEFSNVRFFGTVNQLSGIIEDGMKLRVSGSPRLHPKYGFSINIKKIAVAGEGSIKRAADLLAGKLKEEGLFNESRKRQIIYPPKKIGLITSTQSAAYVDFIKVLDARFGGVEVYTKDVLVQGERAEADICQAISELNIRMPELDVIVITRGGGSLEDLAVFSTEAVVRAVATSQIPTLVAIGHEIDVSLAELAADKRASTPSNAAEILVPDRAALLRELKQNKQILNKYLIANLDIIRNNLSEIKDRITSVIVGKLELEQIFLNNKLEVLQSINPSSILKRGYVIVRSDNKNIIDGKNLSLNQELELDFFDTIVSVKVTKVLAK